MNHRNADLIQNYVEYLLAVRGLAKSTAMQYQEVLKLASKWAEDSDLELDKVTYEDLSAFVQHYATRNFQDRHEEGVKARRLASVITTLKGFYNFALEKDIVSNNPSAKLVMPKLPQTLPKFISQEECQKLLKACDGDLPADFRMRAIIYLLYDTGMRVSECANLSLDDWAKAKEEKGVIVKGKGGKIRFVPLSSTTTGMVDAYIDYARDEYNRNGTRHLFPSVKSTKPLTRSRLLQLVKERGDLIGLEVSPHSMRHTFATHMVEEGADLRSIQQILGHTDLATTQIYATLVDDKLQEALDEKHPLAIGFKGFDDD
jgi:integrase/recombinase XerD